ncbi:MAG: solute carrier family 23 protein [Phycisphaeraceae bacterium]
MSNTRERPGGIIYGIDDKPPFGRAVILGIQHVLTMFGATVAIPLLFGPAMGMDSRQIGLLISSVMLCSGVATIIQVTFGSRLPIIQGVSFSFIAAFFAIVAKVGSPESEGGFGGDGAMMMQYIAGAIMVGAVVEMTVGFSGLMGWLRRVISPVVIGPVIMLIGLALFQHGAPKAGTDWTISGLTILLVIIFSLVLSRKSRIFRLFPILLAIVVVCATCWVLSITGVFEQGDPSYVDLSRIKDSPAVRWHPSEIIFPWGLPKFDIGFAFAVLAAYLASMIESFGDYHACSHMAGGGDPTPKQISRGIGCEGVGCFLTGVLGGFSSTSYSENIGLVGLTKVGSRYVVQIGAVVLILLGFFSKFGALAATIPGPVVGGLYCALFGLISAVGIQQLAKCDLQSDRNLFIAGFSLFMGLSVPAYVTGAAANLYPPGPIPFVHLIPERTLAVLTDIARSIGSTGMAVAAILGLILDNIIPGTPEERGLVHVPSTLIPEADDIDDSRAIER